MGKVEVRNSSTVAAKTIELLMPIKSLLHTLTADNGQEFRDHQMIAKELEIDFFFASPYCSWERGSNENLNRLIRQYIPKGTDFDTVTDEFIKPIIATDAAGNPLAKIASGDVVICFNFRTDRGREITQALTQRDFHEENMHKLDLYYLTMTEYDKEFQNVHVIFNDSNLPMTMGEVLEGAGKKQIRIAETEKYPHVTFFFSGGREALFTGQQNILRNSPKVATYDLQPEMSAADLRDALIPELEKEEVDFVCLNFANPDMVGHTGVFSAVVKAVETVDACAEAVVTAGLAHGYSFIIIADHGNADVMMNEDGSPNTAHSTNLVPCILVDNDFKPTLRDGKLGDVSPTILKMMGVAQPKEMTGVALF